MSLEHNIVTGIDIEAIKEFNIPRSHQGSEDQLRPIGDNVLSLFGLSQAENGVDASLTPVLIKSYGYENGRRWKVNATSLNHRDEQLLGLGELSSNDGSIIEPTRVLEKAEDWIRESENTLWVPGNIHRISMPKSLGKFATAGLLLVRASPR